MGLRQMVEPSRPLRQRQTLRSQTNRVSEPDVQ